MQMLQQITAKKWLILWAVFIAGIFLLVEWSGADALALLEYQRESVSQGQVWRLYTGNFTHFGEYHTWMNAAGLAALVAVLFWHLPTKWFAFGCLLVPLAVGGGLYVFADGVEVYRGFSGANYGLRALGLLLALPQQGRWYALAYGVLIAKIIYGLMPGFTVNYLQEEIGLVVAIEAHLAGFCGGTLIGTLALLPRCVQAFLRRYY